MSLRLCLVMCLILMEDLWNMGVARGQVYGETLGAVRRSWQAALLHGAWLTTEQARREAARDQAHDANTNATETARAWKVRVIEYAKENGPKYKTLKRLSEKAKVDLGLTPAARTVYDFLGRNRDRFWLTSEPKTVHRKKVPHALTSSGKN